MLHGLVVMWLAIGSEFPGSNPGNSGNNFFFFFFWILLLKSSKNYNGINSIPKNIKGRKKAKKSYFNDDLNLIPMCWHIFYWQCITWQKIRLRGLCLIFFLKILIISMYLKSATSSNVNKNWQDMQCQIWRNSL